MASNLNLTRAAFDQAVRDFKAELNDKALCEEISQFNSIEAVYDATDAIQKERGQRGLLRNLKKIEPFLNGLRSYAAVIEVFIQSKQDVLALMWGPVKLLLQWANALTQSIDAIINTFADIGERLPEFQRAREMFQQNKHIEDVLPLFFRDLLDLYLIALKFFRKKYWQMAFESMWPKQREKINVVRDQIEQHSRLLRREVTFEHIQEAIAAQKRALEHYEASEKSQRRQEFQAIKRDICPVEYGAKLDFLETHTCEGTGHWLTINPDFIDWKQNRNKLKTVLWLQGIPGAGKTYLCGRAIRELQGLKQARTLYAFLAYTSREDMSALSIFHSIIFQLASGNDDLELMLCQSVQQSFKDSFDATADILKTLICHTGPIYVVIDGLDEIEETDRQRLLQKLLDISGVCDELRLLFSSRAESDLQKLLEGQWSIRVDKYNTESIANFVNRSTEHWLSGHDFLPEVAADLRTLLEPVAFKAKGMFLYANIIFGIVRDLNEPDEIRTELRVLPENLDAAYARILSRINDRNTSLKTKARNLLGWIGCTPTPLTIRELEQALVVSRQDVGGDGRVVAITDLVRTCGPIVEIVDDYVQFVHFTVQEYFFSQKVAGSLSLAGATLSLACCCVTYLSQGHHNEGISDLDIAEHIYSGAYRLHDFAMTTWLRLIELYFARSRDCAAPEGLVDAIDTLERQRINVMCAMGDRISEHSRNRLFESFTSVVRDRLQQAAAFSDLCSNNAFSRSKELEWTKYDPFTTSALSTRVFLQLNNILPSIQITPEQRHLIEWHYGTRPFKCAYVGCVHSRHGFASREEQKTHIKDHELKWFCNVEGCQYATGGFLSRSMRDNHFKNYHTSTGPKEMPYSYNAKENELVPLLYDLIALDDVVMVETLLPDFNGLDKYEKLEIREFAAKHGSTATYDLIHEELTANILLASLSAVNSDVFIHLLSKYELKVDAFMFAETYLSRILSAVLRSDSEEAFKAWLLCCRTPQTVADTLQAIRGMRRTVRTRGMRFMFNRAIAATENRPAREDMLIAFLETNPFQAYHHTQGSLVLANVAETTCSVRLAKWLLDHGATVDGKTSESALTPLHRASRKTSHEAANLMRFLLLQGADPEAQPDSHRKYSNHLSSRRKLTFKRICEGKGAQNVKKWLGVTWDELVTETRREWEKSARQA